MKKIFLSFLIFAPLLQAKAQKAKDSINTEVINVVSSYKPTISDAFKEKDVPKIQKDKNPKKQLNYSINSKPIRSVFRPNIGAYKTAIKDKSEIELTNFVKLGYGNYNTPLLEAFIHRHKKQHEAELYVFNKTSEGGIKGIQLDNDYLTTKIEAAYKNNQKTYNWNTKIGYHKEQQNWYGIPTEYTPLVLDAMNVKQSYNRFFLKGGLSFEKNKLRNITAAFFTTTDSYKSSETEFYVTPTFEFKLKENKIVSRFDLNVLNGSFENEDTETQRDYDFVNIGTSAYYQIAKEDYFFSIGAKIKYNAAIENSKNTFKIYPDLKIDYVLVKEIFNIYGGIYGDLLQNTYREITKINPFVKPNLDMRVTDNNYTAFAGFKGKLSSRIDYKIKASYAQESDRLLFKSSPNTTNGTTILPSENYNAGNSFMTVYDDVKTLEVFGELNAQLNDDFSIGGNIQIDNYTTENEEEAWNLAPFKASLHALYRLNKWNFKTTLFSKGIRKDLLTDLNSAEQPVNIDAFVDLNLSTKYQITDNWSAFIQLNNVLNTKYETFTSYQVQGFQFLAGAKYSFDF
ncbi:MAG: hypothetical protein ACPHXR_01830 [Flavicella sp.]